VEPIRDNGETVVINEAPLVLVIRRIFTGGPPANVLGQ
jgi:hypothetical protein